MPASRTRLVSALRREVERREGNRVPQDALPISTGVPALDRLLPRGGLRPGSLVEYLGSGAGSLALAAARSACRCGRAFIVVDRERQFYPAAWGMELSQSVIVRPSNEADELWALDQALRCPGVGAVAARCGLLDHRDFRRLQLAVESGGTFGLLVRPAQLRGRPTWADVQWLVEPQPSRDRRRLKVELLRCRAGYGGRSVLLEWNEQTGVWEATDANSLPLSTQLADSTAPRRRSRA